METGHGAKTLSYGKFIMAVICIECGLEFKDWDGLKCNCKKGGEEYIETA